MRQGLSEAVGARVRHHRGAAAAEQQHPEDFPELRGRQPGLQGHPDGPGVPEEHRVERREDSEDPELPAARGEPVQPLRLARQALRRPLRKHRLVQRPAQPPDERHLRRHRQLRRDFRDPPRERHLQAGHAGKLLLPRRHAHIPGEPDPGPGARKNHHLPRARDRRAEHHAEPARDHQALQENRVPAGLVSERREAHRAAEPAVGLAGQEDVHRVQLHRENFRAHERRE